MLHTSHHLCRVLIVGIGSYVRNGIGKVVDLMVAVQYISRGAAIWDPPKSVKRPFHITRTLYSETPALMQRFCGIQTHVFELASSRAEFRCHAPRAACHAPRAASHALKHRI